MIIIVIVLSLSLLLYTTQAQESKVNNLEDGFELVLDELENEFEKIPDSTLTQIPKTKKQQFYNRLTDWTLYTFLKITKHIDTTNTAKINFLESKLCTLRIENHRYTIEQKKEAVQAVRNQTGISEKYQISYIIEPIQKTIKNE